MQILKVVVTVMGVLIVAGIGVLGYAIATRGSRLVGGEGAGPASADAPAAIDAPAPAGFGARDLGLPAGSRVQRMSVAGRRLILVVAVPEMGERIVVIDLETGAPLGAVGLEAPR